MSLGKAVEALRHLDCGNRMVERCGQYLEQFAHVLDSFTSANMTWNADILANPEQQYLEGNGSLRMASSQMADQMNQSPLGMDLGEFMLEGDMDFLANFPMPNGMGNGITFGSR